jgi:ribosomal protein S8E
LASLPETKKKKKKEGSTKKKKKKKKKKTFGFVFILCETIGGFTFELEAQVRYEQIGCRAWCLRESDLRRRRTRQTNQREQLQLRPARRAAFSWECRQPARKAR